jgi:hypothetical protein
MKMGGQFPPDWMWSICSGKQPKSNPFRGGQFLPESGGQFDRILHMDQRFDLSDIEDFYFKIIKQSDKSLLIF